jgi:sulfonate dioxygenase
MAHHSGLGLIGGDTRWASGYALYSSFSPQLQEYLSTLKVVHSSVEQAAGAHAAGTHVRRGALETEHPLVRVHPVTGLKSIFVNTGKSLAIDSKIQPLR